MKKLVLPVVFVFTAALFSPLSAQNNSQSSGASSGQTNNQANTGDAVDPSSKGPKGETVYVDKQGKKYFFTADRRKTGLEIKVDQSLKGPKGETVFIEPNGKKYYVNASGVKTYLNQGNTIDKPASDKKGTIKKASAPAPKL